MIKLNDIVRIAANGLECIGKVIEYKGSYIKLKCLDGQINGFNLMYFKAERIK